MSDSFALMVTGKITDRYTGDRPAYDPASLMKEIADAFKDIVDPLDREYGNLVITDMKTGEYKVF